jgi:hypothetical protein
VEELIVTRGICPLYRPSSIEIYKQRSKLNQRHMKWVELLQSYTFILKHRFGRPNKFVDALSIRKTLLTPMIVDMVGLEEIKKLYEIYAYFVESWKA